MKRYLAAALFLVGVMVTVGGAGLWAVGARTAHSAPSTVEVNALQPTWDQGVFSAYVGPPSYGYASPGATAVYLGRGAGIIKAGLAVDPTSGNYEDEGLFAFKPDVTIESFASSPLDYDVVNQYGTNPVWMTIEIDTGVLGDRSDNAVYQMVPAPYGSLAYSTVDAASGTWAQWTTPTSGVLTGWTGTLADVATANSGLQVVRTYLRLGMGNSYGPGPDGTQGWVDKASIGGVTYDFVTPCTTTCYVDAATGDDSYSGDAPEWAKKTIQAAVNQVSAGGTVHVAAGTYSEDVNANKANMQLLGAGVDVSTIVGQIGGDGATVRVAAGGVVIDGFTLTRAGNNVADWNLATLNFAGVAVQGMANTVELRNSKLTGNRTGIDINNSNGNSVHNNIIDDNRTGMLFRNQTDSTSVVNNFITNNWTIGVLFLDASGGTNVPVQTAASSTFSDNSISGNWYGQVEDRQAGGSLPAPGTNLKNFVNNWWGSLPTAASTAQATEPGYSAQIPVAFGGTATAPGGQPEIKGSASANITWSPFQCSGTDTSADPGFQPSGVLCTPPTPVTTVVTASSMTAEGWLFYNDETDTIDPTLGSFVTGPGTPALGTGSAQMSVSGSQRRNLATYQFSGTPLASITTLKFRTYNPSAGNGGSADRSAYLNFNVDFDGSDTWQKRLVFVPRQNGTVLQNTWQEWDAINWGSAVWSYSGATWPVTGQPGTTLKTWAQILSDYPGVRVRVTDSFTGLRVGEPYSSGSTENIDTFTFGTSTGITIFNFEDSAPCAAVCYVNATTGNDAFDGATSTSPKRTIQAGVNQVSSGGTVNVAAGTYTENVSVTKALDLAGAGQASTTVIPAVSIPNPCAGSSLCGSATAASNIILVGASDVTIHDMTLDGDNPSLTSAYNVGGANLDARNGIVENYYAGVFNNTTVHDVTVKNIYLRGIYVSSGGSGFNLHHNTVENVRAEYASIGIFNWVGSGTIANNTVSYANDAISANHSSGTQFLNNTVTHSGSGVHTDNAGDGGGVADLIDGNNVSDCAMDGYGVWTFSQYLQPTVKRNVITGCAVGMAAAGSYVGQSTLFQDNEVDGTGALVSIGGSTGLYITTQVWGFASANVNATLTGNVFTNNADGVYYESEAGRVLTVDNTGNAIYGNSGTGATTAGGGTFNVKMLGDWWGSDTGPANATSNPGGTGNSVADGIAFSPWLGIGTDASGAPGFQKASPMTWIAGPAVCDGTCIQKAIDFSSNGDTVKAKSGVFNEHVTLNKAITLTAGSNPIIDGGGTGDGITVTVPNATVSSFEVRNVTNGIVVAAGANNATISSNNVHAFHQRGVSLNGATGVLVNGNTIDGEGGGTTAAPGTSPDTDTRYYGVFAVDSTGTISGNMITGITHGPSNGLQSGVGIRLSARSGGSADMTISGNALNDIQKGSVVVMNPYGGTAVNANVTGNTVTGNGPITYIAQNGIQVSSGATATVSNNDVSGFDYAPSTWAAAGILLVSAGTTSISNNNVHDGQEGMIVQSTNGVDVTGNTLSNIRDASIIVWIGSSNGTYSDNHEVGLGSSTGVYLGDNSANNTFSGNSFRDNDTGVAVDYNDYGSGTPSANSFDTNCIAGNASAGMMTFGTVGVPVDAENNWWGRVDGPAPAGSGDAISPASTIDAAPFLTAPAAGCAAPLVSTTSPSNSTATVAFGTQPIVTIQDAGGNPVTSGPLATSTVSLAITGPNPSGGVLSGTTSVAAVAGVATFSGLSIDKAGTYTLTATDSDASLGDAVSASFTISAGPVTHLVVAGYTSPTTAGTSHGFTVAAKDVADNVVTTYAGTVHFTSTDVGGGTVLPANYTFVPGDAGSHAFAATLTTAGTQSITATDTVSGSINGTQASIVVNPAAAAGLLVAGYPSPSVATVAENFTVTAKDAYGNTDVNYTGTVHFTSSEYSAALPADYAFVAGDAGTRTFSATMNLPVVHSLTATDTVSSITGTQSGIVVTLLDTDNDGCADVYELGLVPPTNGLDPWDFYSVPVPALYAASNPLVVFRDSIVSAGDAQAVFAYFKVAAKTGTAEYEQDLNANGTKDGIEYDRSFAGPGHSGPPDGVVSAADAQMAFAQFKFGYHCSY